MSECKVCGHEGCEKGCLPYPTGLPWSATVTGIFDTSTRPSFGPTDTYDIDPADCDCPADEYLTVIRVMAREIEALESDADAVRDLLSQVLDYVRWGDIPETLCEAIDAELSGNVEDDIEGLA